MKTKQEASRKSLKSKDAKRKTETETKGIGGIISSKKISLQSATQIHSHRTV
jgi:hypothetical protein